MIPTVKTLWTLSLLLSGLLTFEAGRNTPPAAPPVPNLLANPGFEAGRGPWRRLGGPNWGDFEVLEGPATARSGRRAALLRPEWPSGRPGEPSTRVHGVVQDLPGQELPRTVSGWYRVDDWWSESPRTALYLQVVVIAFGDPASFEHLSGPEWARDVSNYQLRYYLAGASEPAFRLANARIVMHGRQAPELGRWVRFELPVAEDFRRLWGSDPGGFDSLRVLFEARWDSRPEGAGLRASVLYDDLAVEPRVASGR